jgi:hypothetical protein
VTLPAYGQDPAEIIRKSLEHDRINFDSRKNYTYQSREENREFDKNGKVTKTEVEGYDIQVIGGRPYERLVMRDDKPLSPKDEKKEQEKLDKEAAKRAHDTSAERAKNEKERAEERRFLSEIPNAFTLRLLPVENVSGKPAWVITADPRPGYKPPSFPHSNLLTKVRAKIWVDQAEYQWVKAEVDCIDSLSFGLGLLRIAAGSHISFEQVRVNDEVWLPSKALIRGEARLAYLKKMRAEFDITYRDYKKFQVESKVVATAEK